MLFTIFESPIENSQIAVLPLNTLEPKVIIRGGSYPRYSPTGHLVYGVEGHLWAVGFDVDRLETLGEPVPVQEGVLTKGSGSADFGMSENGSLVYVSGERPGSRSQLVWIDREGQEEAIDTEPGYYSAVRVSPDGAQLAWSFDGDVHTYDTVRGIFSRVTTDPGGAGSLIWTTDGAHLVFESNRGGPWELFRTPADGTGVPEQFLTRGSDLIAIQPDAWTPDGATLLFTEHRAGESDIGTVSMEADPTVELLIDDEFITRAPAVSPSGRWIAYDSDRSGQPEIYVRRFPELDNRQRISASGGGLPRWSPDGAELFYQSLDGRQLFSVPIVTEPTFTAGAPEVLFEGDYLAPVGLGNRPYDLTPDGDRFVMIKTGVATSDTGESPQIVLVQNWVEELKRLVPTN